MYSRTCPRCNLTVTHKSKESGKRQEGKICWTCANINNPDKAKKVSEANKGKSYNKSNLGKVQSPEWIQKRKAALKGRSPGFEGKLHSAATRQKMSERRSQLLLNRYGTGVQISPWYNKTACALFDKLNVERGWNGYHAENGGEFYIGGYWLDYYEPNQNIVIEFDEPRHKIPSHAIKDKIKQDYVTDALQCKFYRIDSENPTTDHIQ